MLNSEPPGPIPRPAPRPTRRSRHPRSGAMGALVLAGIATAIVVAIWFAFYLLVFVPRAGAP